MSRVSTTVHKTLGSCQVTVLEKVKREKDRRGLAATELALMAGISTWKVYHTLAGRSAKQKVVDQLAKVLGVNK